MNIAIVIIGLLLIVNFLYHQDDGNQLVQYISYIASIFVIMLGFLY